MKKIKYTPDAADKLRAINRYGLINYGTKKAKSMVQRIMHSINGLLENEHKGPSAEEMFGVPCDYRYIIVERNYIFYRVGSEYITIVNIYNEREDFMWLLFGIDTTPPETIEYWGE